MNYSICRLLALILKATESKMFNVSLRSVGKRLQMFNRSKGKAKWLVVWTLQSVFKKTFIRLMSWPGWFVCSFILICCFHQVVDASAVLQCEACVLCRAASFSSLAQRGARIYQSIRLCFLWMSFHDLFMMNPWNILKYYEMIINVL